MSWFTAINGYRRERRMLPVFPKSQLYSHLSLLSKEGTLALSINYICPNYLRWSAGLNFDFWKKRHRYESHNFGIVRCRCNPLPPIFQIKMIGMLECKKTGIETKHLNRALKKHRSWKGSFEPTEIELLQLGSGWQPVCLTGWLPGWVEPFSHYAADPPDGWLLQLRASTEVLVQILFTRASREQQYFFFFLRRTVIGREKNTGDIFLCKNSLYFYAQSSSCQS